MGTSWDIRCIDCGVNAKIESSRDPVYFEEIQQLISHAPVLSKLVTLSSDWAVRGWGEYGPRAPIQWLAQHDGHQLRPVSEYGEIDGTCAKDYRCPCCKRGLG